MAKTKKYVHVKDISEAIILHEDITKMSKKEWEVARNKNIGGSDEGAIHHCGFITYTQAVLNKRGLPQEERTLEESIPLEVGHLLENLVISLFAEKNPGWEPIFDRHMYKHPVYPFSANLDGLVRHPVTGELYILEAKTCSENVLWEQWGAPDDDKVPEAYEWQVRHYMAVTGAVGAIIVCLAGNNANGYRQRFVKRDLEKEKILIDEGLKFWELVQSDEYPNHDGEDGEKVLKALIEKYGNNASEKETSDVTDELGDVVSNYLEIKEERASLEKQARELKKTESLLQAKMIEVLEEDNGFVELGEDTYNLKWKTSIRRNIPTSSISALLETHPDIEEYLKVSTSTSIEVKKAKKQK